MSLRGPNPLTGNNPAFNNSVGSPPGVGIIRVQQGGTRGRFTARLPITHIVGGVERADPDGLRVLVKIERLRSAGLSAPANESR